MIPMSLRHEFLRLWNRELPPPCRILTLIHPPPPSTYTLFLTFPLHPNRVFVCVHKCIHAYAQLLVYVCVLVSICVFFGCLDFLSCVQCSGDWVFANDRTHTYLSMLMCSCMYKSRLCVWTFMYISPRPSRCAFLRPGWLTNPKENVGMKMVDSGHLTESPGS